MVPVFGDCGVQVGVNALPTTAEKKSFSLLILDPSIDDSSVISRTNQRNNVGTKNIFQYCLTFS
jgi:hypothetical protein